MTDDLVGRLRRWCQNTGFDGNPSSPPMLALARIEALEAALAPFAKAGSIAGERSPYGDWYAYRPAAGDEYAIYGDHLRAAYAALTPAAPHAD